MADQTQARVVHQSSEKNLQASVVGADPAKGVKGRLVISIDLDKAVGPTSTGSNIMIGSSGRNISLPGVGTLGVNLWREAQTEEERKALLDQASKAARRKALEDEIAKLRKAG